jgi:hypothetical protein
MQVSVLHQLSSNMRTDSPAKQGCLDTEVSGIACLKSEFDFAAPYFEEQDGHMRQLHGRIHCKDQSCEFGSSSGTLVGNILFNPAHTPDYGYDAPHVYVFWLGKSEQCRAKHIGQNLVLAVYSISKQ